MIQIKNQEQLVDGKQGQGNILGRLKYQDNLLKLQFLQDGCPGPVMLFGNNSKSIGLRMLFFTFITNFNLKVGLLYLMPESSGILPECLILPKSNIQTHFQSLDFNIFQPYRKLSTKGSRLHNFCVEICHMHLNIHLRKTESVQIPFKGIFAKKSTVKP